MSACYLLSLLTTSRHNAAGRFILQAVRTGARGAYLFSADVGVLEPSVTPLPRGIPAHVFDSLTSATSRPDLVLCVPGVSGRKPSFICVELKYCCEWRLDSQRARALAQHQALIAALQAQGYNASTVVLLLGVSGTIYKDTLDAMHAHLGVSKQHARDVARRLHLHAVHSLSSIYGSKRKLDAASQTTIAAATTTATAPATVGPTHPPRPPDP